MNKTILTYKDLDTDLLEEISPEELAQLLDDHLLDIIRMSAELGEIISIDKSDLCYHLRRMRDMLKGLANEA